MKYTLYFILIINIKLIKLNKGHSHKYHVTYKTTTRISRYEHPITRNQPNAVVFKLHARPQLHHRVDATKTAGRWTASKLRRRTATTNCRRTATKLRRRTATKLRRRTATKKRRRSNSYASYAPSNQIAASRRQAKAQLAPSGKSARTSSLPWSFILLKWFNSTRIDAHKACRLNSKIPNVDR